MKRIYQQIWQLAKPYYFKGRPMDIEHIQWMMRIALQVAQAEKLPSEILIPLVILHDVGYANVEKSNFFKAETRRAHMKFGAQISKDILTQLNYPQDFTEKIVYYVSVHDNWALGDHKIYQTDKTLGTFTDLDFIWMASPKGFKAFLNILKKTANEIISYLHSNEKLTNRPFANTTTKDLYYKYISDRELEYKNNLAELVYDAVSMIPKGQVTTYKLLAEYLGKPNAARAVGNALNKNPHLITIPCHRVVKSGGSIGGYARDLKEKIKLLENEGLIISKNKIQNFNSVTYNFQS